MRRHPIAHIALFFITAAVHYSFGQATKPAALPALIYKHDELNAIMKRAMDFQIKTYGSRNSVDWQAGAFWTGVFAAYKSTGDDAFYQAAKHWGETANWKVANRPFDADSITSGQTFIDLYLKDKQPEMIADLRAQFDKYFDKKTVTRAEVRNGPAEGLPWTGRNVWWWCDALYMAPAAMARMSAATGDHKYLDLMHSMYWDTTEFLFDKEENLFFRDASWFFDKKQSPTGKKVFWSRGNGWVYGGLIRTLDFLPADDPQRAKYIDLYKKMTGALVKLQGEDGLWRSSLNEPTWFANPESTGSGFFTFGLLAGINRGYLDRAPYLPIALRAWRGLAGLVGPDGGVNYAQPVGAAPADAPPTNHMDYAQGAFLLAASEIYSMKLTEREVAP